MSIIYSDFAENCDKACSLFFFFPWSAAAAAADRLNILFYGFSLFCFFFFERLHHVVCQILVP